MYHSEDMDIIIPWLLYAKSYNVSAGELRSHSSHPHTHVHKDTHTHTQCDFVRPPPMEGSARGMKVEGSEVTYKGRRQYKSTMFVLCSLSICIESRSAR